MSDKIDQPSTVEKSAKPEVKFVMPRKWAKRQAPHPQEVWLKVFCAAATACASKTPEKAVEWADFAYAEYSKRWTQAPQEPGKE